MPSHPATSHVRCFTVHDVVDSHAVRWRFRDRHWAHRLFFEQAHQTRHLRFEQVIPVRPGRKRVLIQAFLPQIRWRQIGTPPVGVNLPHCNCQVVTSPLGTVSHLLLPETSRRSRRATRRRLSVLCALVVQSRGVVCVWSLCRGTPLATVVSDIPRCTGHGRMPHVCKAALKERVRRVQPGILVVMPVPRLEPLLAVASKAAKLLKKSLVRGSIECGACP